MEEKKSAPGFVSSVLRQKCSRCRRGNMFKYPNPYNLRHFMKMNEVCSVCGQAMEIEPGFYFGTGYVSYALTVAISVSTFIAWWVLIGLSSEDNRLIWWLGSNIGLLIVLQPILIRLSRSIWLSWFVKYDPDWEGS